MDKLSVQKNILPIAYRLYLLFAAIQSLVALVSILQEKSEKGAGLIFGLSSTRIALAIIFLLLAIIAFTLFAEIRYKSDRYDKRLQKLAQFLSHSRAWSLTMIIQGGLFLLSCYFISLFPDITEPFTRGLFDRLMPIAVWLLGMSAQTFITIWVIRYRFDLSKFTSKGASFYIASMALAAIFLCWSLVMRDIYETESQLTGWNSMGVPIIGTQLFIAWLAGMVFFIITITVANNRNRFSWIQELKPDKTDLLIMVLLWLITVVLWNSIPITPSWFLSEPAYPNFENYPTSDARAYDVVGQTALIGKGYLFFGSPVIKRPLHALYITVLRFLGGQDYNKVIFLQILILALFPPLIYQFSRKLYNQTSGVIAAVVIMLREANSIGIAGAITASHVKLIMVDFPTALTNLIFVLFSLKMLQQIDKRNLIPLVTGAALGFTMLLRLEAFVLLFPLIVVMAILLFNNKKNSMWIRSSLLLLLGVILVIVPWIWRNWKVTGIVYIDSPVFRYRLIAQRFKPVATMPEPVGKITEANLPTPPPSPYPTELASTSTSHAVTPTVTPIPQKQPPPEEDKIRVTMEQAFGFIRDNPRQLVSFFMAHYLNSQLQTILIMPTSYSTMESFSGFLGHKSIEKLWEECCSVKNYVRKMPYWHNWDSKFPSQTTIPLIINSIILATGVSISWKKHRIIGITPIFYCVIYLVFNSIFRNSGGRYVLPVDWIIVAYFSIGLAYLSIRLISAITGIDKEDGIADYHYQSNTLFKYKSVLRSPMFYILIIAILLFSSTIPLVEKSFPRLYNERNKREMLNTLYQSKLLSATKQQDLESFTSQGGLVFSGRALYPQFYRANSGGIGDRSSPQSPKPYARLIFYLIGQYNSLLMMPMKEKPAEFTNASDVLVFMCPEEDVLAVANFGASGSLQSIWMNSAYPTDISCPIPLPGKENK